MVRYHFNPRHACVARVTVVGSVCVCVNQQLTSGASVLPENNTTYSMGNEGQRICVDFSEMAPLQRYSVPLPALYGHLCSRPFW